MLPWALRVLGRAGAEAARLLHGLKHPRIHHLRLSWPLQRPRRLQHARLLLPAPLVRPACLVRVLLLLGAWVIVAAALHIAVWQGCCRAQAAAEGSVRKQVGISDTRGTVYCNVNWLAVCCAVLAPP